MISHAWTVLCQGVSIDIEDNNISIFKVLESLTVIANPKEEVLLPVHFELVTLWSKTEGEEIKGRARYFYCDPTQTCSKVIEIDIDFTDKLLFRTRIKGEGLKFRGSGLYTFYVELEKQENQWEKVCTLPLWVMYKEEPQKPENS